MRRHSDPPRRDVRYTHRPGVYGIILKGDKVLIALNESPGEEIALPGGGIDPGETPLRALHREAMEETGWRIRPYRRVGAFRRFTYMPDYDMWAEKVCQIYLCAAGRRVADPVEPDHMPVWMDVDLAAEMLSVEGDRAVYRRVVAGMGVFR